MWSGWTLGSLMHFLSSEIAVERGLLFPMLYINTLTHSVSFLSGNWISIALDCFSSVVLALAFMRLGLLAVDIWKLRRLDNRLQIFNIL